MRTLPLALVGLLLLAGCASPGAETQSDDPLADVDFGDAKATETTGIIRGVVVDPTITPLVGAVIAIPDPNRTAVSGQDGQFTFAGLEPGFYLLSVTLANYTTVSTQVEVVANDNEPQVTKVVLERLATTVPYMEKLSYTGFLSFGAAIGITSVGSTIYAILSENINDKSIWNVAYTEVPRHVQSELVWDQTQAAGGMMIWEQVRADGSNTWRGYRETGTSPALAYWNSTVTASEAGNITDPEQGIDFRFFGGPHPMLAPGAGIVPTRDSGHPACTTFPTVVLGDRSLCSFGYGVTLQQRADAYIHSFYNFVPPEGWRFTSDGDPVVPPA